MNPRKTVAALAAVTASLGALAIATPAEAAAARTLTSGVYVTPAGRDMDLMPRYTPVARPGMYKTSGRPAKKACALRAVDQYNWTVANVVLVKRTSFTIKIPATAVVIEVSGVCKWKRK